MSKRKLALLGNLLVIIGLSIGPMLGGVRVAFAADPSFWTITPSPNESTVANYLWGVSAVKSGCVVAVGSKSTGGLLKPAIQRWDGIQWKAVLNQPFVDGYAELNSVTSVPGHSPNTYILWAVGYKGGVSRTEDIATGVAEARAAKTLIERSEDCGMNWTRDNSVDPNPNPSTGTNILRGVTAINARDV